MIEYLLWLVRDVVETKILVQLDQQQVVVILLQHIIRCLAIGKISEMPSIILRGF